MSVMLWLRTMMAYTLKPAKTKQNTTKPAKVFLFLGHLFFSHYFHLTSQGIDHHYAQDVWKIFIHFQNVGVRLKNIALRLQLLGLQKIVVKRYKR